MYNNIGMRCNSVISIAITY